MSQAQPGKALVAGLAFLAGLYILSKILTPKKGVSVFYCPKCRHIVNKPAPYCWYCRVLSEWQSSPVKGPLKRTLSLSFLGILTFLVILRYAIYPFTGVSLETCAACERGVWLFGGVFARDFGGYFGQTIKG